ncbi:MAG: 50S ribosomal protein L4 [Patescibacteria group bacterium]
MSETKVLSIYNIQGEVVKEIPLPDRLLSLKINKSLVHQVVVGDASGARAGTAHTKTRGEVSGGGRKPWKQKGTGRARHGSTRSPIWVGGGVVFGPRNNRNYVKRTPESLRSQARAMVLADYLKSGKVTAVESWPEVSKTKVAASWLKNLKVRAGKSALLLLSSQEKNTALAFRNLPKLTCAPLTAFTAYSGLQNQGLLISENSLTELVANCLKNLKVGKS